MPHIDESRTFHPVNFAVITVSDTRTTADDRSGDTLVDRATKAGLNVTARTIVTDDQPAIRAAVQELVAREDVDVILTTGGTGFTGRDVTPDAIEPLFTKRMDGFSTTFHTISFEVIGVSTLQSRATAGLIGDTFVFVLPGSPGACRDAWENTLVEQLDNSFRPCNCVEIFPRINGR